jgi:LL-diaminopimelate aminotransferase
MTKRNPYMAKLKANYLFPEIKMRRKEFLEKNPQAKIISLGIGDTTEPIPESITKALVNASQGMGTPSGYSGYGPELGMQHLREKIAHSIYKGLVEPDDVIVSDGAKCDIGRLQALFGNQVSIALQDPSYPVYIEGSLIQGVQNIHLMACTPENHFFPDLKLLPPVDLIYFCSPNNPTGATATHAQLTELVKFAKAHKSIIIFDSAYANYIQDPALPRSIYEIEGAKEVAVEISSFSKLAGFTGIRLGWTVIPEALKFDDGTSVKADWKRLMSTIFNGASNIAQMGGYAVLEDKGMKEVRDLTAFYLENAAILKRALEKKGLKVFGGTNAPYLWVNFKGRKSWEVFQELLEKYHIVATPGEGFGKGGEEFVRFSAFGNREHIQEAAARLVRN